MKRLVFLVPLSMLAGIVIAFAAGLQRDPSILPSQLLDQPLPAFARTGVRPGELGFGSATLRGEPALLNVWASWCGACRSEHPTLIALHDWGVPIYGLAWKDEPADAARVLASAGNSYRANAEDRDGRVGIDLGVNGAPGTLVVDRRGRVRYRQIGAITPQV